MKARTLTCSEFQEHLPELFSPGSNGLPTDPALQAHLQECENCSALVRDLKYIADQAKLLLEPALDEPADHVWNNIQSKLKIAASAEDAE